MRRRRFLAMAGGALLVPDLLSAQQGPAPPLNVRLVTAPSSPPPSSGTGTLLGGWRLGQDYAQGTLAMDFSRMKAWMSGGSGILEFDLPAMNTGTNSSAWPRLMPTRTIAPWWPAISGAVSTYPNGLIWWQGKLWASPRGFYVQGAAVTEALTIYAQDGQSMTFPNLPRQIFSGFVKRGPGLDPLLGCGGYESGQGSVSGPTLATLSGQRLIEYQWPADPGPVVNGVPVNWNLRAPRDTNYSINMSHPWVGWDPRVINGKLEGRWAGDIIYGGGLVLSDGITYWPWMGTGLIAYEHQRPTGALFGNERTYTYRYDPSTYQFRSFTLFGTDWVRGQELGPDGKVYLACGQAGPSGIGPADVALKCFG